MRKGIWGVALFVAFGLILAGGVPPSQGETKMLFVTGPSTGGWYPTGAAIGEIIMNKNPDLKLTVVEGGGVGNIRDLNVNKAQIGYTFSTVLAEALQKKGTFQKETIDKVTGFLTLYISYYQAAVHADSPIRTYADLAGKNIAPGRKNWSGEILTQRILEAYGLSYDSIRNKGGKINFVGFSEMVDLMRDRHIDACMGCSAAPSSFLMDIKTTHKIRFLEVDRAHADKIIASQPGLAFLEMPPNTYADQPQPVRTMADYTITLVRKDLPVDMVYRMTKSVMENLDTLHKAHPVISYLTKETALKAFTPDQVHPGVVKYFKEVGVIK
ncbi:MAG TPA: TAXI family TRAP transporter solute-binding subunit [Thermodesulfobacteriota bacterium]|nr:TAXI family TRAP transporter solute-binding subunit [Thermodesulfobacteriota bacterium]